MGSTLRIVDIMIDLKSLKLYISALKMFEQILSGYFVGGTDKTRGILLSFLHRVTEPSVLDVVRECADLEMFVDEEAYDTDAVLNDVEDVESSNITRIIGVDGNVIELIKSSHGMSTL